MSYAPAPTSTSCWGETACRRSPATSPSGRRPRVNLQQATLQQAALQQAALQQAALQQAALQQAIPQRAALQRAIPQPTSQQRAALQRVNPPPPGCPRQPRTTLASPRGRPAGRRAVAGSLAARINVTVPLSTILGLSDTPGEVAAFGPIDGDVTRDLIHAAGLHPATRWCVTVVGPDGQAVGHGCAHGRHRAPAFSRDGDSDPPSTDGSPPGSDGGSPGSDGGSLGGDGGSPGGNGDGPGGDGPGGDGPGGDNGTPRNGGGKRGPRDRPGESALGPASPLPALNLQARTFIQRLGVRVTPLAVGTCDHRNEEPGYTLSPRLRHLIAARTVCCSAPGCRRPAARCDFDHTIAYEAGGRSCECNVQAPVPAPSSVQAGATVGTRAAEPRDHDLDDTRRP